MRTFLFLAQLHLFVRVLAVVAVLSACAYAPVKAAERPSKPNVIIMMADDMGIGDTSASLGVRLSPSAHPILRTLRTPNLARFARSAIVFTDGYAPASMCSATRYSLLTGRFSHRSYLKNQGWLPHGPNTPMVQKALTTLPEMLQQNGFRTAGIGKYHIGMSLDDGEGKPADDFYFHDVDFTKPILDGPTHHGFDEYFGVTGNTEDPLDTEPRVLIRNDRFTFTDRSRMNLIGMKNREGRILAAPDWDLRNLGPLYLREAETFIDRQSKQADEPFFLYMANYAVHTPIQAKADVTAKYEAKQKTNQKNAKYAAMVESVDDCVGKILAAVDALGMSDRTVVIFTSDNGGLMGPTNNAPLRSGKGFPYEGGIRVPLIVRWPGVTKAGSVSSEPVTSVDYFPTLVTSAGAKIQFLF